jgi:hypothetical protein
MILRVTGSPALIVRRSRGLNISTLLCEIVLPLHRLLIRRRSCEVQAGRPNSDIPLPYVVHGFRDEITDAAVATMLFTHNQVDVWRRLSVDSSMYQTPVSLLFLMR